MTGILRRALMIRSLRRQTLAHLMRNGYDERTARRLIRRHGCVEALSLAVVQQLTENGPPDDGLCWAIYPVDRSWICTRPHGHDGDHAVTTAGAPPYTWKQDQP